MPVLLWMIRIFGPTYGDCDVQEVGIEWILGVGRAYYGLNGIDIFSLLGQRTAGASILLQLVKGHGLNFMQLGIGEVSGR